VPALVKGLSDTEGWVRCAAAIALGKMGAHAKDAVPALIKALSDTESYVRADAAIALGKMGAHAKDAVPALREALLDKEKYVWGSAQMALDLIAPVAPVAPVAPEDKLTAPKQFPKNSDFDVCKALSAVSKNPIWDNPEGYRSEGMRPQDGWDVAMSSLQALYLSKAGPVSKNSEATCSSNNDMEQLAGFAQSLISLIERNERSKDHRWSSTDIYAKIYRLQLLRGKNALEAARIRTSLIEDLRELKELGIGGSAFNAYAWGAAVVALAPEIPAEILTKLEEWVNQHSDKMALHYGPYQTFDKPSRRASAARNVPVHLALFLGKKGKVERSRLLEAIEVWKKYSSDLAGEVPRDGTHKGRDALAPYYFYSSLPYVTSAIKILEQEGALEPDELARLRVVKKELRSGLPKLMNSDGTLGLLPGGPNYKKTMYTSSPAYTYPLYGLALIPLLEPGDSCMKDSLASDLGIVNLK
ncbi:MAG: HEAT repeat domain-containing protein, partial [Oligoflexia bacterium]